MGADVTNHVIGSQPASHPGTCSEQRKQPPSCVIRKCQVYLSSILVSSNICLIRWQHFRMPHHCCIVDCSNSSKVVGKRFFGIPTVVHAKFGQLEVEKSTRRRRKWIERINRASITFDKAGKEVKVCSDHFLKGKSPYSFVRKFASFFIVTDCCSRIRSCLPQLACHCHSQIRKLAL